MNYKKLILSILTAAVICSTIFLCGCRKGDGDVGDNPNHSATNSPSATISPTASNTQSPLESMIPDVMK